MDSLGRGSEAGDDGGSRHQARPRCWHNRGCGENGPRALLLLPFLCRGCRAASSCWRSRELCFFAFLPLLFPVSVLIPIPASASPSLSLSRCFGRREEPFSPASLNSLQGFCSFALGHPSSPPETLGNASVRARWSPPVLRTISKSSRHPQSAVSLYFRFRPCLHVFMFCLSLCLVSMFHFVNLCLSLTLFLPLFESRSFLSFLLVSLFLVPLRCL